MPFCTFVNGNIEFNHYPGSTGKLFVRFRGALLRTVTIWKKEYNEEEYPPHIHEWTSCPQNIPPPSYISNNIWGDCTIVEVEDLHHIRIRPEFDTVLCTGQHDATNPFTLFSEVTNLELSTFKLSHYEFHDGNNNYVDIIIVLEDNGGGGGCQI